MRGGLGDDTYVVAQSGDVADETGGSGADTVKSSIAFSLADTVHAKGTIEHLTLIGTGAINATGNGSANTLIGNSGVNTLDGLGGNDTMRGMGGNDTYIVAQSGDVADETGGNGADLVTSSVTFSFSDGAHAKGSLDNLTLTGSGAINATGNSLANLLVGNSGANILDGRGNADTMRGGLGNDTYVVDNAGDTVDETGGGGTDTVLASVGFGLAPGSSVALVAGMTVGGIENLTLTGSAAINATGSASPNTLIGNGAANVLAGGDGNDRLTGKGGVDAFLFDTAPGEQTNLDHITDLLPGTDEIRIDASIFKGLKTGALKKKAFLAKEGADTAKDKHDRVIYDEASGELRFDSDGKGGDKAKLFAILDGSPDNLSHTDFLVVA
jgi:Ca2+-binding RTX toxin-like protein